MAVITAVARTRRWVGVAALLALGASTVSALRTAECAVVFANAVSTAQEHAHNGSRAQDAGNRSAPECPMSDTGVLSCTVGLSVPPPMYQQLSVGFHALAVSDAAPDHVASVFRTPPFHPPRA